MWLLQLGITLNNQSANTSSSGLTAGWWVLIILLILAGAAILVWRRLTSKVHELETSLGMQVLLVTVPKEIIGNEQTKSGKQYLLDQIGVAEVLWSALGGLKPQSNFASWFSGRDDHVSLELVAQNGLLSFYVVVPPSLRSFLEQQILSHYPHANIEEIPDYNIFLPKGSVSGAYLKFSRPSVFPLKTYTQLEADSLNSLTNALSKVPSKSGVAVQLVARSAPSSWRRDGVRIASEMQQGKSLAQAAKKGIVPKAWRLLVEIFGSSAKNKAQLEKEKNKEPRHLSPLEQELVKGLEQKASKAGLEVTIRLVASALTKAEADKYLYDIANSFGQFSIYEYGNRFEIKKPGSMTRFLSGFIHRWLDKNNKIVLNSEELASLYHFPLPTTETPNIRWLGARRAPIPVNIPHEGITLGINRYRGDEMPVKIKTDDRRRHVYIIGKSGTGKSVLLQNMIVQDIKAGYGVGLIDPHGDLVEGVLGQVPESRFNDVVIFNPSDVERPVGLNMLEYTNPEQMDFAVQEMIAIFYKLFPPEMIGPMFEHNMRNVMLTLMADKEHPGTIADIPRMFTDKEFQKYKVTKVTDPVVRAFWEKEMAQTTDFHKSEMLGYLISKVGRFVENEMMRNVIGQPRSGFSFREIMDQQKILLVNLSKGTTGEVNSSLLGLIVVSKLQMAAMSRASVAESARRDFYLYIDEFQNFITDSISTILSEARKYRLDLTIANQYLQQLVQGNDTKIRDAVLGTVGTLISFKIGIEDAELLAKEFAPVFSAHDLVNIEQYNAYVKLLVDNAPARPFNMKTSPPQACDTKIALKLKELSRLKYGRPHAEVEAEILERTKLGQPTTKTPVVNERTL
ncbi:MAG: type IV secretory system conjugative DNA transfer family protein [Patescibacteria group bacterium]